MNFYPQKGKVNPSIDRVLRELTKVAFEAGYEDLKWIDRVKTKGGIIHVNVMLGVTREDCNAVILDELTNIANKIRRAQDLKDTQSAKF
ncbi:hypothetical protein MM182_18875 [Aeromonas sp. MR19]|uniref:hypothetical protein n=1 Tax=Aeromonas sp. MR19 TaxID=2923421 RepID=UPI001F4AA4F3|nr:hypothetical protein [Aeromonas sp. MR19]MCH7377419.1 hypothetical protein [Aeromonas sp. MR19]